MSINNLIENNLFWNESGTNDEPSWIPSYWQKLQSQGMLHTYKLNIEQNRGIRLWTSAGSKEEAGIGAIYQVIRLLPPFVYTIRVKLNGGNVGTSLFLVPYFDDEIKGHLYNLDNGQLSYNFDNDPAYFLQHCPITHLLEQSNMPPFEAIFHAPRLSTGTTYISSIYKVGVSVGPGAGQYVDIESIELLPNHDQICELQPQEQPLVTDLTGEFEVKNQGEKAFFTLFMGDPLQRNLRIHAVEISFILEGGDTASPLIFRQYSPEWKLQGTLPRKMVKVFNAARPKDLELLWPEKNLAGKTAEVLCRCFTDDGYVEIPGNNPVAM